MNDYVIHMLKMIVNPAIVKNLTKGRNFSLSGATKFTYFVTETDIFGRVTQHTRIGNFCTNKKSFAEIYTRNTKKRNGKKITEQAILRLVFP